MSARELEATANAVDWFLKLRTGSPTENIRYLKEMAAKDFGVSVATLNRALNRRNKG